MPIAGVNRPSLEIASLPNDRARVFQGINDNIDFIDQSFAQASFTAKHGTEVLIANPYGASSARFPVAVLSSYALDSTTGLPVTISSVTIGAPRADKKISVTVQYAPPLGRVLLARTASQTIANNTRDQIQWDTRRAADQGSLSCDILTTTGSPPVNSRVVCAVAGEVSISGYAYISGFSAPDYLETYIIKNNAIGPRYTVNIEKAGTAEEIGRTHAAIVSVAANDYLTLSVFQTNTGLGTRLAGGGLLELQAKYVAPDPATTAIVKAIFISGS